MSGDAPRRDDSDGGTGSGTRPGSAPTPARKQDAPEPERIQRVDEAAGEGQQELEDPPQAEGDREAA